jgi:hypothetical protein
MGSGPRNVGSTDESGAAHADGSPGPVGSIEGSPEQSMSNTERIARRAYERFEQRGGEHGRDMEDWFEAERDLLSFRDDQ